MLAGAASLDVWTPEALLLCAAEVSKPLLVDAAVLFAGDSIATALSILLSLATGGTVEMFDRVGTDWMALPVICPMIAGVSVPSDFRRAAWPLRLRSLVRCSSANASACSFCQFGVGSS